jgi:homoserine kinase
MPAPCSRPGWSALPLGQARPGAGAPDGGAGPGAGEDRRPDAGARLVGREILVPGSTSNLGPGFDCLSLALRLYLRLIVREARDDGRRQVAWRFPDPGFGDENLVERGYRALADRHPGPLPSLDVEVASEIPVKAGLGSSAAALVAGLRLFELVAGPVPIDRLVSVAARLEGHPDNTSASLLGGLVVSATIDGDRSVARAMPWPSDWRVIVATPSLALPTAVARAALPASVPHRDAVFNVQRVALLLEAVRRADADLLRDALADRLHEPYRAPLVPGLEEAGSWKDPALLGVVLSGAGPSLAAFVTDSGARTVERFEALYRKLGLAAAVRVLEVQQPFEGPLARHGGA